MLKPHSVYGFADNKDVEGAIEARLSNADADNKGEVATLAGEAIAALLDINEAIPVQSKHRHLVANALENFANGPKA
jgi:hypothetical protein